jgi:hypothetical protein
MIDRFAPKPILRATPRPTHTADTAVEYLDWIMRNLDHLGPTVLHHMAAAELAIRIKMGEAQAKATQHTLVEQGIIDQPTRE